MKKNKYFYLSFTIYLLLNPVFMAAATVATNAIEAFSDIEKAALGLYFIIWIAFGLIAYVSPMLKAATKPKEKAKTMDEIIDDCWEDHKKEQEATK